jgi:hypothetical protein
MIFKPGDKIYYKRPKHGQHNGVVVAIRIHKDRKDNRFLLGHPVYTIRCGQFEDEVHGCDIRFRVIEKQQSIPVADRFKKMSTKRLLGWWRMNRRCSPYYHYNIHDYIKKYDGEMENFFDDIGFEDYNNEQHARDLVRSYFERDLAEVKYELSKRENVESGRGMKVMRQKRAKMYKGQRKNRNR